MGCVMVTTKALIEKADMFVGQFCLIITRDNVLEIPSKRTERFMHISLLSTICILEDPSFSAEDAIPITNQHPSSHI